MALNFNTTPYYDDFDADKNFHRILFRPGRAVQARELTQSQTLLQDQLQKFGDHIFKDGSRVTGAQLFSIGEGDIAEIAKDSANLSSNSASSVRHVKLQSTFDGTSINVSSFIGNYITTNTANVELANVKNIYYVHHADGAVDSDPDTLYVSYIRTSGSRFGAGTGNVIIDIANSTNLQIFSTADLSTSNLVGTVTTASADAYGKAKLLGVTDGVFYTNGVFVKNSQQIIAVDKYNANANVSVGFEVQENIIASTADTTLLDPALDSSNYLAPGGDRYKITLNLSKKDLDTANASLPSLTTNKYIELVRYKNGSLVKDSNETVYSELGRTLAQRTYDESGDYIVEGLRTRLEALGNTDLTLNITGGKAYVKGYEVNKTLHTRVPVNRARDTETVTGYDIPTFYGNFINVTGLGGAAFNSNVSERVELFSSNTVLDNTTKVAEAYVRNQQYVSGSGTDAIHKLSLFNLKKVSNTGGVNIPISLTKSIKGVTDSANCNVASLSITSVESIASVQNNTTFLRVTNPEFIQVGDEVFGRNVSTQSAIGLGGEQSERRVFVTAIQGSNVTLSNVSVVSDETSNTYTFQRTNISETKFEASVFESSYDSVASINDINYDVKRVFKSVSFTAGTATINTNDGSERFKVAGSDVLKQTHYMVIARTTAGSFDSGEQVDLSPAGVTFSTSNSPGNPDALTIDLNDGSFTGQADILATIDITSAARRTKTANSHFKLFDEIGNTSTSIIRSLGITDLVNVTAIYISNEAGVPASTSNTNVLEYFTVDTGQRDSFYDHATIKLKESGIGEVNTGGVNVVYNRFQHTGTGHFDANSYPVYEDIPQYTLKNDVKIDLRDSVDFRPTRADDETSNVYSNTSMTFTQNQIVDSREAEVDTELTYYLGRIDKLVLDPSGDFRIIEGKSALNNPPTPLDDAEAMTILKMSLPPYTYQTSNVKIDLVKNRRYTMRDIGGIDHRLTRMEYYTALNLLESDIAGSTFYDDAKIQLFNNGFIVDDFKGHGIGDVLNPDYKCSIDYESRVLHPRFKSNATNTSIVTTGLTDTGNTLTVPFDLAVYAGQNVASSITNINPFNVVSFVGHVELKADVTTYADFNTRPQVGINNDGGSDNFEFGVNHAGSRWNEWLTVAYNPDVTTNFSYYDTTGKLTSTTSSEEAGYSGAKTVADEIFYFMAPEDIEFEIYGYRPNTPVFLYLDGKNISASLRKFNTSTNTYDTGQSSMHILSDANGYVKGLIKLSESSFQFAAGEHTLLFIDNIFSDRFFTSSAVTNYYSGTPESKKPKEVVVVHQGGGTPQGPVNHGFFYDSPRSQLDVHNELLANDDGGGSPGIATTITQYAAAVNNTYRASDILNRPPDIEGYKWYLVAINNFQNQNGKEYFDPDNLRTQFLASEEFAEFQSKGLQPDPLSQTFFINEQTDPQGIFLAAVDIFFSTKASDDLPVTFEIRKTVNGYPSDEIYKFSQVTKNPSDIVIPSDSNIPEATRFTFKKPLFLLPGEYAMVLKTSSSEYNVFIAEVGKNRLDTNQTVVSQPYLGSLFKSQNASTWTPEQGKDLCFVLLRAQFDTSGSFTAVIEPKNDATLLGNFDSYADLLRFDVPFDTYTKNTSLRFQLAVKANGSSDLDPYIDIIPGQTNYLNNRKVFSANTDANLKITMSTTDDKFSPTIDLDRARFIFIEHLINATSNTNVTSFPETLPLGGGASSKYITKKVTLEEGFDANALRVFLAKNLPSGASVKVYYRVQADIDNSDFNDIPFVEMTQVTDIRTAQNISDFYDCEYKAQNISYTSEEATFDDFRYFQIKIVMFATNTSKVPLIKNLRAIALS